MTTTETAPPPVEVLLAQAQEAIRFQTDRAERAEAKAAEYESAVTWETSCTSCARVLDSCARETERAERAEAEAARLRGLLEERARTEEETFLTPAQASKMLRISRKTLIRWSDRGEPAPIRTAGGHRRFRESEVRALLQAKRTRGTG